MAIPIDEFLAKPFSAFGNDLTDHLGNAATAKHSAQIAVKQGRYNDAWTFFHLQKEHYMKHASKCGFTKAQTLALDASVHLDLANILRLEKRNIDALIHIIYCNSVARVAESTKKKLIAYFKRSEFKNTPISELYAFVRAAKKDPDFCAIQEKVYEWERRNSPQ